MSFDKFWGEQYVAHIFLNIFRKTSIVNTIIIIYFNLLMI